jgi:peroxiredoxin
MKRINMNARTLIGSFKMRMLLIAAFATLSLVAFYPQAFSQSASNVVAPGASGASVKSEASVAAIPPKVGEAAPDFKLPYATLENIYLKPEEYMALSAMRGKNVILAFYPADWSGGCTKEVCTLRDTFSELAKLNAMVLGVSGDYVFSHHEWAKFHKLQFPLLSDHDHKIARLYGSFNEAVGFNKRTVFLIDKEGVVRYSNLEFKAGDAADYNRLREELGKLK